MTLVVALVAIVVSFLSYLVANGQKRIAEEKLRHDLYDRRFAIYMAFHELLVVFLEKNDVEPELRNANAARAHCPFLLDESLGIYLDELHKEVFRVSELGKLLLNPSYKASLSPENFAREASSVSSNKLVLANRIKDLSEKFTPFLRLNDFMKSKEKKPCLKKLRK